MRVLTFLLQKAKEIGKPNLIENQEDLWKERVLKVWNELPECENCEFSLAAVDGSCNRKVFSGYSVYAVGAVAVLFNGRKGREEFLAEVGVLKPEEFSEQRINVLMGLLELKTALKVLDDVDFVLMDGSLLSMFVKPAVFVAKLEEEEKKVVEKNFERLKDEFSLNGIDSRKFYEELGEIFEGTMFAAACGYLEYLEYLYSLTLLVSKGKGKLISVAKRSNSRNYGFDRFYPDSAVLNKFFSWEGYTEPLTLSVSKEVKFKYPELFEERLRKVDFVSFFYKEKFSPALKVETLTSFEKALSVIRKFRVNGYPLPLKVAHDSVKITKGDIESVIDVLKQKGLTGREPLGE